MKTKNCYLQWQKKKKEKEIKYLGKYRKIWKSAIVESMKQMLKEAKA